MRLGMFTSLSACLLAYLHTSVLACLLPLACSLPLLLSYLHCLLTCSRVKTDVFLSLSQLRRMQEMLAQMQKEMAKQKSGGMDEKM